MGTVVPFPERRRSATAPRGRRRGEPDRRDEDAELYILSLHRRGAHPAGTKLPRRRASE